MNLTVFKNGGENYSFGRTFAGLVIVICMAILCFTVVTDYNHPTKPIQMTRPNGTIETILVAEPNFSGYQSFMIGIATLAGAVYGMSKFGSAAETFAGRGKSDPPAA